MQLPDPWIDIISHGISALLGGGLAQLLQHRVDGLQAANQHLLAVLAAMSKERDSLSAENDVINSYNDELRHAVLMLENQVLGLGQVPICTLSGGGTTASKPGMILMNVDLEQGEEDGDGKD